MLSPWKYLVSVLQFTVVVPERTTDDMPCCSRATLMMWCGALWATNRCIYIVLASFTFEIGDLSGNRCSTIVTGLLYYWIPGAVRIGRWITG